MLLLQHLALALRRCPSVAAAAAAAATGKQLAKPQQRPFSTYIPDVVKQAFESAPFEAALIHGAGRGLVATRALSQGDLILSERPFVCTPTPEHRSKVCYNCLSALPLDASSDASGSDGSNAGTSLCQSLPAGRLGAKFCGAACLEEARGSFLEFELRSDLSALDEYCVRNGERFPLLAARLALMLLQRAARGDREGGGSSSSSGGDGGSSSSGGGGSGRGPDLGIGAAQGAWQIQEAAPPGPLAELGFLCYANVGLPPPQPWQESFELLRKGISGRAPAADGGGAGADEARAVEAAAAALDLEWYTAVLARLHLNTFRVDCVFPIDFQDFAAAARAAIVAGGSISGSALYLVAALLNHSCEPNVNVAWPRNDGRAVFTAARDIAPGEQLAITYTDSSQAVAERRAHLLTSYGFECGCQLCTEQLAA